MALTAHVTDRVSNQLLKEITNFQVRGATSVNTVVLGHAADDIEGLFQVYAGVAYSDTDNTHIPIAVEGVVALLMRRGKQAASEKRWKDWEASAGRLSKVEGAQRITPVTTSSLVPSVDTRLSNTPRPDFDRRNFDPFIPNNPGGGGTSGT